MYGLYTVMLRLACGVCEQERVGLVRVLAFCQGESKVKIKRPGKGKG